MLTDRDINYYSTFSDKKAAIVERFNKTLKTRMWKYFTANETRKWIDIVDNLVNDYTGTFQLRLALLRLVNLRIHLQFGIIFMGFI